MLNEIETQQISDELKKMNYDEIMETLMHVNLLIAEKQNKIVFSECDYVH